MALLHEPAGWYGTRDGICVYRMFGKDFMRTASSLTGKRVKSDPAFISTMQWAERMVLASRLASAVYAMLPAYRRRFVLYRRLTGRAMRGLKAGMTVAEVVVELMTYIRLAKKKNRTKIVSIERPAYIAKTCKLDIPASTPVAAAKRNRGRPDGLLLFVSFPCVSLLPIRV